MKWTYKDAGVDVESGYKAVKIDERTYYQRP
jgi:phosphoribosylaminoimidazole (AIR) synthetase